MSEKHRGTVAANRNLRVTGAGALKSLFGSLFGDGKPFVA